MRSKRIIPCPGSRKPVYLVRRGDGIQEIIQKGTPLLKKVGESFLHNIAAKSAEKAIKHIAEKIAKKFKKQGAQEGIQQILKAKAGSNSAQSAIRTIIKNSNPSNIVWGDGINKIK